MAIMPIRPIHFVPMALSSEMFLAEAGGLLLGGGGGNSRAGGNEGAAS
jgi:hypothetical protein